MMSLGASDSLDGGCPKRGADNDEEDRKEEESLAVTVDHFLFTFFFP